METVDVLIVGSGASGAAAAGPGDAHAAEPGPWQAHRRAGSRRRDAVRRRKDSARAALARRAGGPIRAAVLQGSPLHRATFPAETQQ